MLNRQNAPEAQAPGEVSDPRHTASAAPEEAPLLAVENLSISFRGRDGDTHVTRDVSFSVHPGERLGMVGESGCGKTVTGLALLRLLPERTARIGGRILFDGRERALSAL